MTLRRTIMVRAAAVLLAVGCGYSPNPESGTLKCGPGDSCPEGYTCGLSNACWRPADKPEPLLGCWIFDPNSIQQIDCSDNSTDRLDLSTVGDFVVITAGATSPLATDYYCAGLKLLLHGQTTQLEPDQGCTLMDTATGDTFVHSAERFSFSTSNGSTARLELSLPFTFQTIANGSGECTLRTSGTLTKGTATTCPPILPPILPAQSP